MQPDTRIFAGTHSPLEGDTQPIDTPDWFWLVGSLAQLHRQPYDAERVARQFPAPHSAVTLREALGALGLSSAWRRFDTSQALRLTLPAVAFLRPGAVENDAATATHVPVIIVKTDGERLLFFRPGSNVAQTALVGQFAERFESNVLPVARDSQSAAGPAPDDPDAALSPKRFGYTWFIPELLRHKRIFRDVLLASLAIQLMGLATPLLTQVIIDKVIVHHTRGTLWVIAFALGAFMLFSSAMTWVRQYLLLHTGNRVDAVLGARVFGHLMRLPMGYFEARPTGTTLMRLQGVETIREFIAGAAVSLMLDLPFLLIFLGIMLSYSVPLALVALTGLTAIAALSLLVTPLLRRRLERQFQLGARNQALLTEYLSGMATVKSLQMEPTLTRRYEDALAGYLGAGFHTRTLGNTCNVLASAIEQAMTLAILVIGALMVMDANGFTLGMLVAFQMFASRLSQPLMRLAGLWQEAQQAHIAIRRLGDLMDMPAETVSLAPARAKGGNGAIDIRGLSFRYDERLPWLFRAFDMNISPGSLVVLKGPSGCGKSTLTRLLLGFLAPTEGQIRIDGHDVRHLGVDELRAGFGVVPQETVLFAGSLLDNLLLANPNAGFEDAVTACRLAEIHDAIEALPGGYQTLVGERGVGLSGGQRQRIAVARALLKTPRALIFDEATSNLDRDTAAHLARTINGLRGQVTVIFITHQPPDGLLIDATIDLGRAQEANA